MTSTIVSYVLLLLAGALLCNSIPHLASGLRGEPFPTPFSQPRGIGNSPALVNMLWGAANLGLGLILLDNRLGTVDLGSVAAAVGFVAIGTQLSLHFGRVWRDTHGNDRPRD